MKDLTSVIPRFLYHEKVAGKTVVLTTTNGTKALHLAENRKSGGYRCFPELEALSNWIKNQDKDVLLLCAGWKDQFNLEDTIFAGAVVNQLRRDFTHYDDASVAAEDLYLLAKDDLRAYIHKSSHSNRMVALNIEEDVKFCLQTNICQTIPVLEGDQLVALKTAYKSSGELISLNNSLKASLC